MKTSDKLQRIERIQRKLEAYRTALETISRLEKDPEVGLFLGDSAELSFAPHNRRKPQTPGSGPRSTRKEDEGNKKTLQEPTEDEHQYYGETDQETVLRIAHEIYEDGEVQASDLFELIEVLAPNFAAEKKLDEKKVNDHLNRAYNAGEIVGGFIVERVAEGKRGRGGYPATYSIKKEKTAEGSHG